MCEMLQGGEDAGSARAQSEGQSEYCLWEMRELQREGQSPEKREGEVMTSFHISTSIEGALAMPYKKFARIFDGLCSDDNGKPLLAKEARKIMKKELKEGHKLIRAAGCDNFDPIEGCLGHGKEEVQ